MGRLEAIKFRGGTRKKEKKSRRRENRNRTFFLKEENQTVAIKLLKKSLILGRALLHSVSQTPRSGRKI